MLRRILSKIGRKIRIRNNRKRNTPLSEREGYETIFNDDSMTVLRIPGRADDCIISFTGVGHALGGIDLQNPEFSKSNGDETKIFIIDKQRSWGNNLDWGKLEALLAPLTQTAQITTIGNSMGGFLAILSANRLGATHAIAFAPQWSIDPGIVPQETRWAAYREKITHIRFPDLSDAIKHSIRYSVFFGNGGRDAEHLAHFAQNVTNLDLIVFEDCEHDVARFLKDKDQLYQTINTCRAGGNARDLLREAKIRVVSE